MPSPEIAIALKRLPHGEGLPLPAYATEHAAGMDVVAAEDADARARARATPSPPASPSPSRTATRSRSGRAPASR